MKRRQHFLLCLLACHAAFIGAVAQTSGTLPNSDIKKLTITQSMVDAGYTTATASIDTIVLADDVTHIDFTAMFTNRNELKARHVTGALPDSITTWRLPVLAEGLHTHDRFHTVYDTNGDGRMESISKDSYHILLRSYYGVTIDTLTQRSGFGDGLYEFANLRNNGKTAVIGHYSQSYSEYVLHVFEKDGDAYRNILEVPRNGGEYYDVLDLNGDGLPDIVNDDRAYLQQRDGSFLHSEYKDISTEEADSLIYQTLEKGGGSGMSASVALSFNNVVSAYTPPATTLMPARIALDIDCNGHPDLIDLKTGNVLFNHGNNRIKRGNIGSKILALKDLNGDGVTDLLSYDKSTQETSLFMYVDGEMTRKVLERDLIPSNAWCYDFDHDGDADILLAFDFQSKMGWSFLIFYRNDGNNTFKKKETGFDKPFYFRDCADTDNDGLYEVLTDSITTYVYNDGSYGHGRGNTYLITCTAKLNAEMRAEPLAPYIDNSVGNGLFLGDMDGDGLTEYSYRGDYKESSWGSQYYLRRIAATPNTPPARMSAPNVMYDGASGKLNVSWTAGSDTESSPIDLTYALRIGSAPGQGDMLYADANADGRRLNLEDGNMGYSLSTWVDVNNWPSGEYYLSVQAVDPNHMGGAWSEETVYRHQRLSAGFTIDHPNLPSCDTLTVAYSGTIVDGYTYNWSFGDSALVVSHEGNRYRVVYRSSGAKTISLRVTDADGNASPLETQTVTVVPGRYVPNKKSRIPHLLADWDMDGTVDGVMGWGNSDMIQGFYTNDGTGTFKSLGKSFNMNNLTKLDNAIVTDYNMDGLPDLVAKSNKGNIYINEEDFDFSIEEEETTLFDKEYDRCLYPFIPDMDNDGLPDISKPSSSSLYRNMGNLQQSSEAMARLTLADANYIDVNHDGYMDIISREYYQNRFLLYLNQGNWMFQKVVVILNDTFEEYRSWQFGDVDNDGYPDLLKVKRGNEHTLTVVYGDAGYSYTDSIKVYLPEGYRFSSGSGQWTCWEQPPLFDVDNDGYLDLCYEKFMVCFRPGRTYEVFTNENLDKFPEPATTTSTVVNTDLNGDGTPDTEDFLHLTAIANTAPQAPANLRVLQGGEGVVLEWDDAIDRETPKVRMRYNVSLKHKGATGEGAYLISPLNGERDEAAIVPTHAYLTSTRMPIPLHRFEVGKEYELRVQAIDGWNTVSPMSEPFTFTFEDQTALTLSAEEVCAGEPVEASYEATMTGTPQWDTDGGELYTTDGNTARISWSTGGTKQISVTVGGKTATRTVYVIAADTTDLTFTLPDMVLGECQVPFTLPEVCRDPSNKVRITTSSPDVVVERRGTSLDARVTFPAKEGAYTVTLEYESGTPCGNRSFSQTVWVNGSNVTPVISIVSVDGLTGKTTVHWDVPDNVLADPIFDKVVLYKEEGRTGNFIKLTELPLSARSFTDPTSDPTVRKSRYRITLGTTYGGESNPSAVHSNVHVMLNKGLHNAVNIIWTKYEGALIDQYTIWRGTSPDNMTVLATASGNETSYTDFTASEYDNLYYALSYSNVYETEWIKYPGTYAAKSRRTSAVAEGFSNRTAKDEGIIATLPTTLAILSLESEAALTPGQTAVHLLADLLPATTTIKQVNWTVTEGAHLARINNNGTLEYIGNGETGAVTVQAATIDGSGLTATIIVPVQGFNDQATGLPATGTPTNAVAVYPNPTRGQLFFSGIDKTAEAFLFNTEGMLILRQPVDKQTGLSIAHLPNGVYMLTIQGKNGETLTRQKVVKM